jgi:hypothetical protein
MDRYTVYLIGDTGPLLAPGTTVAYPAGTRFETALNSGAVCQDSISPPGPTGNLAPYTYVDQTTNCSYKVEFLAWDQDAQGAVRPVVKISKPTTARASGGVIGGCNFDPVIYVGGGGGGGLVIPWLPGPDSDGQPWWVGAVQGAIGGAVAGAVDDALDRIFGVKLPATTYRLVSACETDAGGEPVSQSVETAIPELPIQEGIAARLDALVPITQGLKDFKQPVCRTRPQLTGDWVTVNFLSDEPSPAGERPLRKVFRYRDQTSASQNDHVAHWEGFTWQAGPVMVVHKGASWGTPKVWAQTPAEGKRVIRHAAAIAGVDTEAQETAWIVSGASDPRYGQTGTMRVSHKGGVFHVSKRPTASGLPLVPRVFVDS